MRKNTVTVKTDDGDVVVHKLAIADYAEVLRAIRSLPRFMEEFESLPKFTDDKGKDRVATSEMLKILPNLSADLLPEVCDIISHATDKDGEFMKSLDLGDFLDVIAGVLELNKFDKVIAAVKKMTALNKSLKPEAAIAVAAVQASQTKE